MRCCSRPPLMRDISLRPTEYWTTEIKMMVSCGLVPSVSVSLTSIKSGLVEQCKLSPNKFPNNEFWEAARYVIWLRTAKDMGSWWKQKNVSRRPWLSACHKEESCHGNLLYRWRTLHEYHQALFALPRAIRHHSQEPWRASNLHWRRRFRALSTCIDEGGLGHYQLHSKGDWKWGVEKLASIYRSPPNIQMTL